MRLRLMTGVVAGFALVGMIVPAVAAPTPYTRLPTPAVQSDPYQALKRYDMQDRRAAMEIVKRIQAAGQNRAALVPIEEGLVGVLQDPSSTFPARQEACRLLWEVGTARSVPVLAKMLPDPATNDIARYALERNSDPAAAAALRTALGTTKGSALIGVINSVGDRGDAQAVPALRRLAASKDAPTADAATAALGKIGAAASLASLKALPAKRLDVYDAMLRSAEKQTGRPATRRAALETFEGFTGTHYPPVIRIRALKDLQTAGSPRTGAIALQLAQTGSDPDLQRAAAAILGRLGPTDAQRAIAAFPNLPASAQVALLTAWADRKERLASVVALGALRGSDPEVRRAAIPAVAQIGARGVAPLIDTATSGDNQQAARDALARMSGQGVQETLVRASERGDSSKRAVILGILAERPGQSSTEAMVRAASDPDPRVASAALKGLGSTGSASAEPPIIQALKLAKDDSVREAAASAFVAIAQRAGNRDQATDALVAAMSGASPEAQTALISAMAEVGGDRALDQITRATTSSDSGLKAAAVNALANTWSDTRPLPTLLQIAKSDPDKSTRVVALRGYLRIVGADLRSTYGEKLDQVKQALSIAERPEEKRQALSVLRDVRISDAVETAAQYLDDPALNAEAADAIVYLAAPQRHDRRSLPAVTGPATNAALDKVIQTVNDENVRNQAQKLRQG